MRRLTALLFWLTGWAAGAAELTIWTTDVRAERVARLETIARSFAASSGHIVKVEPVEDAEISWRITEGYASGNLPDLLYIPSGYLQIWARGGVLDVSAASSVIADLGAETFEANALDAARVDGRLAAVPVDGWTQMLVYRKDLFEARGLEPPTSFAAIRRAIAALHNPPDLYAFVAPTKRDEAYLTQVIEHLAIANGYDPARAADDPALAAVLSFYASLVDASPPGDLSWWQARERYFAGEAAMIIWSPLIIDELAGLRDNAPVTYESTAETLAERTGFVGALQGPGADQPGAWLDIRYLAISVDADREAAEAFARYLLDTAYLAFLASGPEGKFPLRTGRVGEPARFTEGWANLTIGVDRRRPLGSVVDETARGALLGALAHGDRWGLKAGRTEVAAGPSREPLLQQALPGLCRWPPDRGRCP